MTQLIFNHDAELAQWAEKVYPICAPLHSDLMTSIGFASSDGRSILGVAFFNNFMHNHKDIEISVVAATPKWATPGNIRAILHYAFVQLGVHRMTASTSKSNTKARRLIEFFGGRLEGVHPNGHLGREKRLTYGLQRKDADRWLR